MKIQSLAVIFIIIILPISMILTSYVQSQVKTLELQISYDTKLTNATYDALKAFQLNTANSSTSDLANSKLRDIEASVNTFFNSISSNFNMAGYNKDILKEYVPALVYTMYDGYYIYSPFTNTLGDEDYTDDSTYQNGEKISGLKPYIHYSCRYKASGIDVVITYSLDNYITVEGVVNDVPVYKSGYLLDNVVEQANGNITYRGVQITNETLQETGVEFANENDNVAIKNNYYYTKINGVKYYTTEPNGTEWFSIMNGQKYKQSGIAYKTENDAGKRYYQEANEFTKWVRDNLGELTTNNAVDENGNSIANIFGPAYNIFGEQNGISIEDSNSNFNQQRLAIIRYSIEKNLSIAIANYNNYSGVSANFQMPKLKEDEWEKIINNVSIISFMQGLSIGGKIYNGYSIVTNTKTEEVVNIDSIYITTSDGQYHRATDNDLINKPAGEITGAYLNTDFERKSVVGNNGITYYYPHEQTGCYTSIVNQSGLNDLNTDAYDNNIYKYMENIKDTNYKLAQTYFTALGRERYSMYKTANNMEELKNEFSI